MYFSKNMLESILTEDAALSKGSNNVFKDSKLVTNIANTVRDDADFHPGAFPNGMARKFEKMPDADVARWFLEELDKIEQRGYEGSVYSRDGVNNFWITQCYVNGTANWEDIYGNLNMILRDWYLLKNRGMLEPRHDSITKFKSINDLGAVVTRHYGGDLEDLRKKDANKAKQKLAKSILLVDNDDYRIYLPMNRVASCLLGDKAMWCTANSEYDTHYHSYAGRAMLFIIIPYYKDENGKKTLKPTEVTIQQGANAGKKVTTIEKYQFDTGSMDFMDITNRNVKPELVAGMFPHLYSDIKTALKVKKPEIEAALASYAEDPTLQTKDTKIKMYDIDKEAEKLGQFLQRGHFTNSERKAETKNQEQLPGPQMEKIKQQKRIFEADAFDDIVAQLSGLSDPESGGRWPHATAARKRRSENPVRVTGGINRTDTGLTHAGGKNYSGDLRYEIDPELPEYDQRPYVDSDSIRDLPEPGFGNKNAVNLNRAGIDPDDIDDSEFSLTDNLRESKMSKVDKDVAAMLKNLKKYDMLAESVAPVLAPRKAELNELMYPPQGGQGNPSKDILDRRPPAGVARYPQEYKDMKNGKPDDMMSKYYGLGGPKGKLPEEAELDEVYRASRQVNNNTEYAPAKGTGNDEQRKAIAGTLAGNREGNRRRVTAKTHAFLGARTGADSSYGDAGNPGTASSRWHVSPVSEELGDPKGKLPEESGMDEAMNQGKFTKGAKVNYEGAKGTVTGVTYGQDGEEMVMVQWQGQQPKLNPAWQGMVPAHWLNPDNADVANVQKGLSGGYTGINESADPEVLEWMARFAKLGKMG